LKNVGLFTVTAGSVSASLLWLVRSAPPPDEPDPSRPLAAPLLGAPRTIDADEALTALRDVTTYNNFYEFGTGKGEPARNANSLRPRPWTVRVGGEVAKPQTIDIETVLRWFPLEERIYRMRCVEGWSMVIPWVGFPLRELVRRVEPTGNAKYVQFKTLLDPEQMPAQRRRLLPWPYVEGLRLDEAVHPLTNRSSRPALRPLPCAPRAAASRGRERMASDTELRYVSHTMKRSDDERRGERIDEPASRSIDAGKVRLAWGNHPLGVPERDHARVGENLAGQLRARIRPDHVEPHGVHPERRSRMLVQDFRAHPPGAVDADRSGRREQQHEPRDPRVPVEVGPQLLDVADLSDGHCSHRTW
jgi:DMSO/TMAO reductase YedYZ molybdopterin-dependent catalytic subunit